MTLAAVAATFAVAFIIALSPLEASGCGDRFQWNVLDWNQLVIDFYKQMRARMLSEWRIMRIDGEALHALASH